MGKNVCRCEVEVEVEVGSRGELSCENEENDEENDSCPPSINQTTAKCRARFPWHKSTPPPLDVFLLLG